MIYRILIVFFLIGISSKVYSQTTLAVGDIAIIWNQTDPTGTGDSFAFVTFIDLDPGTVIYFTDCGADAAGFNTPFCDEGALAYTVPAGGLTAGDIITYVSSGAPNFAAYTDSRIPLTDFELSTGGDQIIVFQDDSNAAGSSNAGNNPRFIFASNTASTLFTGNKADRSETGLPDGLSDTGAPRSAVGKGAGTGARDEFDNSVYTGTYDFSSGGIPAARIALTNPANYYGSNGNPPGNDATYDNAVSAIPSALTLAASCAATDTTPPVPDAASLPDVNAQCQVTSLTPPTATDNCGGTVIVTSNASLPITAQGTTVVTWTFDDGNGNTSTQNQNVVINDTTAPVPNAGSLPNVTAQCQVTALTPPTATDNCGGIVTVTSNASLPITAQGTTVVTWTFDDGNGNTSTQNQNVVINDTTAPVPDAASLPNLTAECSITSLTPPTATDNCGGTVTVTNNATLPITTSSTITWTFDDGNGNTSTQNQNVVINDTTAPVPDAASLPDITAECSVTALTPPTATDNCGGTVTVTNNATLPITTQGTTVVTWTFDDGNGNTSTQNQNVILNDVTNPVPDAASLPDVTAQCQVTALTPPTATDNCGGTVTVTNNASLPITAQGTTVVTWTYDDGNGNTSTQNQNVVINDTTAPTPDVASLPDVTAQCQVTALTPPTATDNCGGTVTVTNNATLPITTQGTTVVTWTYDDGNGNTSTQNQNVVINDTTAPTPDAASLPDITAACEVTSLTPPTATDNCGGTVTVTNNATLPITASTVVTWTFDDGNGNTSTQNQNVVINDTTAPVPDAASLPDITAECSVTSLTPPTATDNCGGTVTVTNNVTLPITAQGTTIVTWTFDDGNGNTSTQNQNVILNDVTAPVPDAASLPDVTAQCQVTALTPPTATDNCGGTVIVTNNASLPITAQGTTVVTWTYDDGNGNTSTQNQNVVINDTTAPTPDVASLPDVTAQCQVTALTPPTATDNCGGTVTVTNNASLPITAQGTTVITWTYDDGNGNTSTQNQNVVVDDTTPPVPDAASLPDLTAECEITSLTPPTATDNCGGTVTVTNNVTLPITASTTITWTFDDGNGNTSTQNQNVVINDTTPPVPDAASLPDITAECSVTTLTPPTATDNCGGTVTVTNNVTLPITAQGTTIVTWTFDDGNGNTSTQNQNVILDDVTDPVPDAASLPDVTAQCEVTSLTPPTATDNCGGTVIVTNDATLPINTQGTTVVTWTYDDGNGNSVTQTQNVVIDDTTAPTPDVASLPDVTAECEVTALTPPTATDNCGGTVTVTSDAVLPINTQGTTVVTWIYDDGNGNTSTQTQNVVVDDITPPVPDIGTLPDVTAECVVTSLTPPTATDNCGGTVTVTNNATLPITSTTLVTWSYNDGNGNVAFQNQNVVIDDVTAPVPDAASLPDITAECSVTSLTPPTATDNCGGTVTVTNNVTLPITAQGTTVVTWTFDDGNGNTSTQNQNVILDDITDPVPDVAALPDITAQCEVTALTPPTATDNCGGTVIVTNDATLPINTQGTTVVTWTYDDGNGNTVTQTQNVVIADTTAPTPDIASLPDVTAECEVTALTPPTATDNCGGTVTVTSNAVLPINTQGTTVVTWTYDDGNGNTSTQNQNVVIDDVTAPVPDVASLPDVTAECEVTALTPPTATDNCGGTVTVTSDAVLPINTQGTTVITWTFDDGNGNTSTQTQNVVINDVTAPVPDAASLPDITAECSVTSLTPPTATDNCGGTVTVTNNVTLPITAQGTTVVTWTFDDGNGNTSTQNQNVILDDITDPVPDVAALPDITAQCEVTALTPPTATDNCGGTVTVTSDAVLPINTQGTTVVTWTYDDGNGNTVTQTQNVVIDDTTAPTPDVASLPDVTAECEVTALTPPTATDNCGGTVTVTSDAVLPINTQGTTVVTWTYDDGNGNTSTQTQNVVIDDVTAPVPDVATLPDVTSECEVTSLVVPSATDNCGGTVTVTSDAAFPINTQGTTVVTWTFDDGNGNTSTQTQDIVINDVTDPVPDAASLPDVTAECEVTSLTPPTATDNCGGTVTVTNDASLPINTQGTTVVTWTFDDGNGNTTTQTQNVVINDVTNPVAVCADIEVTLDMNGMATITAAQVDGGSTDNCAIASIAIDNSMFTCADVGPNTVTLTVTDINGNTDTCEATVTVVSDGMAVASNNGPICDGEELQLSETSGIADSWLWTTDGSATIDDPTSQNPSVTNVSDGETFTVTITFAGGCTATASTTATVNQTLPPTGESTQEFCQDEVSFVTDIQVDTPGTVLWYATATGDTPLSDDTVITNGTTYYASQFNEDTGCESLDRFAVTIVFINCADISTFKKRAFSPNGDGINDTFTITDLRNNYPNYSMEVYNRNGSLLFRGNASQPDWDGTSSEGSALGDGIVPNGVYFFIINFGDGETKPFQGIVYLNR